MRAPHVRSVIQGWGCIHILAAARASRLSTSLSEARRSVPPQQLERRLLMQLPACTCPAFNSKLAYSFSRYI